MAKRLVLLLDGTWNDAQSQTNIKQLFDSLAAEGTGMRQQPWYQEGLGVRWYEKRRGGLFAHNISSKIQKAYRYLSENYQPEDEVFIFGFSRGAFAALALVGFCFFCGLRKPKSDLKIEELFCRYRAATVDGNQSDHIESLSLHNEGSWSRKQLVERLELKKPIPPSEKAMVDGTQVMPVKFVGVFDTVRSAGIEPIFSRSFRSGEIDGTKAKGTLVLRYTRHLPDTVVSAFHAMAVDEYRASFAERVWIVPKGKNGDGSDVYVPRRAEQRWFAGAHANIGGGYPNDDLHRIPLRWMQDKASKAGLAFTQLTTVPENPSYKQIRDSFREMGKGAYALVNKPHKRTVKPLAVGGEEDIPRKSERRLNETIDESVLKMIVQREGYTPTHITSALERIASQSTQSNTSLVREALDVLLAHPPMLFHNKFSIRFRDRFFGSWLHKPFF